MTPVADRFRTVAADFSAVVDSMGAGDWDRPTPCDGWVARDVVAHLVEWIPGMVAGSGVQLAEGPDPADDPAGAWHNLARQLQAMVDDESLAGRPFPPPMNELTLAEVIERFVVGDVLVHTWDLGRAVDHDVSLDAESVAILHAQAAEVIEQMQSSGHFGPSVEVGPDASPQDRLLALSGRDPAWRP